MKTSSAKSTKSNSKTQPAAPESGVHLAAKAVADVHLKKRSLRLMDIDESSQIALDSVATARQTLDMIYAALRVDNGDLSTEYIEGCQAAFLAIEEIRNIRRIVGDHEDENAQPTESAPLAPDSDAQPTTTPVADWSDAGWCVSLVGEALKFTRQTAVPIIDAMALNRDHLEGVYKKLEDATFMISRLRMNLSTLRGHARAAVVERNDMLRELTAFRAERDAAAKSKAGAR